MNALTLTGVGFGYVPGTPTVLDVTLGVEKGEFLTIVGPNGSGKSTLLRLCSKTVDPHSGRIELLGKDLRAYSRRDMAKILAVVSQDHIVQFPFTVSEIVLMGRSPHCHGRTFEHGDDYTIASEAMKMTDSEHLAHKPVTDLSGGERQRVFIARALAQQPLVILLDEPNAHLDIAHQLDVFGLMKRLNKEANLTVVTVSHDLNLAASYSDRIAMLMNGTLAAIGVPDEILTSSRIAEVFRTNVLVDKHPAYQKPRITLTHSEHGPSFPMSGRQH